MTLTLTLPDELERQLRARASAAGKDVETLARELLEQVIVARPPFDTILAPVRAQVTASGISDTDLQSLFEEAREEAFQLRARDQS